MDVQGVLNAVAKTAARLCDAKDALIWQVEGDQLRLVAKHGAVRATVAIGGTGPISRGYIPGRVVLDCRTIHVRDLARAARTEFPEHRTRQPVTGVRTYLATPLLLADNPVGVIVIRRTKVRPFSAHQIALLKTFADQAAIAIENARLSQELETRNRDLTDALEHLTESLEQQTATSEILRVISSSPTDVQPVFDAIAQSAMRLCDGNFCTVTQYDGELLHLAAHAHVSAGGIEGLKQVLPKRPSRATVSGRVVIDGTVVHIPNVQADQEYTQPLAEAMRARSGLGVPMLHDGEPVGVIAVGRFESRPFTDEQIALLKTFADQAVIAIENVRLFQEFQTRNRDLTEALERLTEALEQQTATAEVLKVISRSTFDLEPVLETLLENATRLCGADHGALFRFDGEVLRLAAASGASAKSPEYREYYERNPIRLGGGSAAGRAAAERRAIHIPDVLAEPGYHHAEVQRLRGYRSILAVPMLREGALVGTITVFKTKVEPFSDRQIELVTTFADQAVIAIENVRLFQELQARTGELTQSVEKLTALGEVSRAVSSTLDLQTVLDTIVARAVQLSGARAGVIFEYHEATQEFHLRATHRMEQELVELFQAAPIRLGEGATGQAAATRAPVQVTDILDEREYAVPRVRAIFARLGYRSGLVVPLLLEQRIMGALGVLRQESGSFSPEVVELLQTFATQSVLAIQNARLFREIADKSQQLEAASQHKSEFLANMSHELRTPLNAIIGFSEVLLERMFGEVNEKQTEYLQDILSSGQHLLSLINDILDLSKIEAGRMELALAPFHLPLALENAVTLVKERAGRHGIALKLDVDPRLGELVGDERKIKQVLLNLLSNAVKFTPEGGRISLTAVLTDGSVEVSVSDTGIGIAPEDQEAIFEEFRQVGCDDDRKREGTGLGLTLSKKFVEMHGGKIWVKSRVGQGSTFTFALPMRP